MSRVGYQGVTKRFGDAVAVDDFTLDIGDGEFLVLVGPSGCGKSTALRLLAGLETLDSGQVSIGDRVVNGVAPKDRDVAMVFQSYALYPHMTAFDNMAFSLKLKRVPKAEIRERVAWAAALLDISELLKRKPKELSGGQRQRVALGRAIVRKPAVFLMDEPLSNLDAKLRVEAREALIDLHQKLRATFLYVTHDQVEALVMADRVAVMNDGKIEQVGTPTAILREPKTEFVASFVGATIDSLVRVAGGWQKARVNSVTGSSYATRWTTIYPSSSGGLSRSSIASQLFSGRAMVKLRQRSMDWYQRRISGYCLRNCA